MLENLRQAAPRLSPLSVTLDPILRGTLVLQQNSSCSFPLPCTQSSCLLWILQIIFPWPPLFPASNISKHSPLNTAAYKASKTGNTQPSYSANPQRKWKPRKKTSHRTKTNPDISTQIYNHPRILMPRHQYKNTISNSQDLCLHKSPAIPRKQPLNISTQLKHRKKILKPTI